MSKIIVRNRNGEVASIEATSPEAGQDARVLWKKVQSDYGFILKFDCQGQWYFQGLHWSCRGGKRFYYKAVVTLYRELRKRNLVPKNSLRQLAHGGEISELRLNGIVLKRGDEAIVEGMFKQLTDRQYSKDEQQFNERRKALREKLNVPLWEGKLELYRLRSAYRNTPSEASRYSAMVEDDTVSMMDTEAMRRIEHEAKYGRSAWTTTAAALLRRRFGTSDTSVVRRLLTAASQQVPGTRLEWIRNQVAQAA